MGHDIAAGLIKRFVSALFDAIVLWVLVIIGVDFHLG